MKDSDRTQKLRSKHLKQDIVYESQHVCWHTDGKMGFRLRKKDSFIIMIMINNYSRIAYRYICAYIHVVAKYFHRRLATLNMLNGITCISYKIQTGCWWNLTKFMCRCVYDFCCQSAKLILYILVLLNKDFRFFYCERQNSKQYGYDGIYSMHIISFANINQLLWVYTCLCK